MLQGGYLMKLNVKVNHVETQSLLVGIEDRNLLVFKAHFGFNVSVHGHDIVVDADQKFKPLLERIFETLVMLAEHEVIITERDVLYIIKMAESDDLDGILDLRSEEHTSELQSRENLVCRLL